MSEDDTKHLTEAEASRLWARFRQGEVVRCPRDAGNFAVAIDGAAKAYRLVCAQCGHSSPWFATTPSGLVFRGTASSPNGGVRPGDE